MENVRTGSGDTALMSATTAEESTPPLRNAPTGTSPMSRLCTALRISSWSFAASWRAWPAFSTRISAGAQ